jgi:YHS domain-containing protein
MPTLFARCGFIVLALSALVTLGLHVVYADEGPQGPATSPPAKFVFAGDPYMLATDPLGDALPAKPIIYQHDGRELRFANQQNLDAFKTDPAKYLPKVDQQMIEQQLPFYPLTTCMVSGDKLGGEMGKPVDLIYENRLVRFCCPDCIKDFKKDPSLYIGKLNAAVIAQQGPTYPLSTCVVSGDKLGEMGKPLDRVYGNRLVRFCCADCPKDFNKDPRTYLKMIDDAIQKAPADIKPAPSEGAAKPH